MKIAERIVMVLIVLSMLGGGLWLYSSVKTKQEDLRASVSRGEYEKTIEPENKIADTKEEDWKEIYPNTVSLFIGSVPVEASVADSITERIKGLSGTPFLPSNVIKLFVFGTAGEHSIWMKEMNYPLDIIWVNKDGEIVHIEEQVSPDTYPDSFSSPSPAWYVIEAKAGFVSANEIHLGDKVTLP